MRDWAATRLKDLELEKGDALLRSEIARVRRELQRRRIHLPFTYWFSHEWFVAQGTSGIAIPFYLARADLRRLARRELGRVDGQRASERVRILRHELGHVLANAARITREPGFLATFGSARTYPRTYLPRPHSRKFVRNLADGYAQSHPDEDFAETFAVWLDPRSQWRRKYAGTRALEKLEWLDTYLRKRRRFPGPATRPIEEVALAAGTVEGFFRRERIKRARQMGPRLSRDLPRILSPGVKRALMRESGCFGYQIDWLLKSVPPMTAPRLEGKSRRDLTRRLAREAARFFASGKSPLYL